MGHRLYVRSEAFIKIVRIEPGRLQQATTGPGDSGEEPVVLRVTGDPRWQSGTERAKYNPPVKGWIRPCAAV